MWHINWENIDWNAISAIATALAAATAWLIWVIDGLSRKRARKATARLLAQVMITPVSAAQLYIAKIRTSIASSNGGNWYISELLESNTARKELSELVQGISLELPEQFLDKADIFSERLSNRIAFAYSLISRLKSLSIMLAELPNHNSEAEINQHLKAFLDLIKETETAIGAAYSALLAEGRSSLIFRLLG